MHKSLVKLHNKYRIESSSNGCGLGYTQDILLWEGGSKPRQQGVIKKKEKQKEIKKAGRIEKKNKKQKRILKVDSEEKKEQKKWIRKKS